LISSDLALREGESTLLTCMGFGDPDVELSWMFNGTRLANTSLTAIHEGETTQRGRLYRQSFLQLCGLVMSDGGAYTCIADNGHDTDSAATLVTVTRKLD
jgi:hypothetical protein